MCLFFIAGAFGPLAVCFAQEFNVNACNFTNIYCLRESIISEQCLNDCETKPEIDETRMKQNGKRKRQQKRKKKNTISDRKMWTAFV